jgi:hypothetical protein
VEQRPTPVERATPRRSAITRTHAAALFALRATAQTRRNDCLPSAWALHASASMPGADNRGASSRWQRPPRSRFVC